jgi:hypothetical protein
MDDFKIISLYNIATFCVSIEDMIEIKTQHEVLKYSW